MKISERSPLSLRMMEMISVLLIVVIILKPTGATVI
jgi:hypothetical protein